MWSSIKIVLLGLSAVAFLLVAESHKTIPLKEDQKDLEKLLNHINIPAIKSFETEHGYILDCIDIQKQLAFDHPLLKNHSIQLKPTIIPKWTIHNNSQNSGSLPFQQTEISCPSGTVIIKRVTLEDLIQAQRIKSLRQVSPNDTNQVFLSGHPYAEVSYRDGNHGAKGNVNIWNPKVSDNQWSLAGISIIGNVIQSISAGWIVNPKLNKNHSILYTSWSADNNTGCFNTLCPGFMHVSTKYAVGALAQPVSTYDGQQYHLEVSLYQDHSTGDWWFVLGNEPIGYWPKALFKNGGLADGARSVHWGGEVYSHREKTPSMGSGHFPQEGFKKAAFINNIQVIDSKSKKVLIPTASSLYPVVAYSSCYNIEKSIGVGEWSSAIFFGGPEGCKI